MTPSVCPPRLRPVYQVTIAALCGIFGVGAMVAMFVTRPMQASPADPRDICLLSAARSLGSSTISVLPNNAVDPSPSALDTPIITAYRGGLVIPTDGAPTTTCETGEIKLDTTRPVLWGCIGGRWLAVGRTK